MKTTKHKIINTSVFQISDLKDSAPETSFSIQGSWNIPAKRRGCRYGYKAGNGQVLLNPGSPCGRWPIHYALCCLPQGRNNTGTLCWFKFSSKVIHQVNHSVLHSFEVDRKTCQTPYRIWTTAVPGGELMWAKPRWSTIRFLQTYKATIALHQFTSVLPWRWILYVPWCNSTASAIQIWLADNAALMSHRMDMRKGADSLVLDLRTFTLTHDGCMITEQSREGQEKAPVCRQQDTTSIESGLICLERLWLIWGSTVERYTDRYFPVG